MPEFARDIADASLATASLRACRMVACFRNPCSPSPCKRGQTCKTDYCNGCNAICGGKLPVQDRDCLVTLIKISSFIPFKDC